MEVVRSWQMEFSDDICCEWDLSPEKSINEY